MPVRPCANPRCPAPATYRGYCAEHARTRQRTRNEDRALQRKIYNSKRWKMRRRHQLFNHPLCDVCGRVAADVHHRVDLADGGDPWASNNLQSLCHEHHSQLTARFSAA